MMLRRVLSMRRPLRVARAHRTFYGHYEDTGASPGKDDTDASSLPPAPAEEPLPKESYIHRAARLGVNALWGMFVHTGARFDRTMAGMTVTRIMSGYVECEIDVHEGLQNSYRTLHGGAIGTLVDVVGTIALLTKDPTKAGVSIELNTSFLSAAKAGETVLIVGKVIKYGRRMGFTQVDIFRKSDNTLIATGRHTKSL